MFVKFFLMLLLILPLPIFCDSLSLSKEESTKIGMKIWHNECAGKIEGLTTWNAGEEFASMGIGHFIWFPKNKKYPFEEQFPCLLDFLEKNQIKLPAWLIQDRFCPWETRAEFIEALQSPKMQELRQLLASTVDLQTSFILYRLKKALFYFLEGHFKEVDDCILLKFNSLSNSLKGSYALIDYTHFKGLGHSLQEQYKGAGWGLIQVLEKMAHPPTLSPIADFTAAAKIVLRQRVENAPPERKEERWLKGWYNRLDTYNKKL